MKLRRIQDISLRWKLLIPFFFLSFVGTTSLILYSLHTQTALIEAQEKRKLFDYYRAFSDQIEERERTALSLALELAAIPPVEEALARRDRAALTHLLLPTYQTLHEKFQVKQLHIHVPPATSFLRLHRLSQWGEHLAQSRETINRVEHSKEPAAGLERGTTGFAVRGVVPVFHHGLFVGTLEVGFSVERPLLAALRSRYPMELALFVPTPETGGFRPLAVTSWVVPFFAPAVLSEVFNSQEPRLWFSSGEVKGMAVLLAPLRDFSGNSVGIVQISVDRRDVLARLEKNRNRMIAIMVVALVLSSFSIWWIAAAFLRPVHKIVEAAREIAAGERLEHIEVEVHDEVGILAESLNDMLASLGRAREEIQAYCNTLEHRVRERTAELVEEKEKFETLVQNAPLVVYRLTPEGRTIFVSSYIEEVLGYTTAEVIADPEFWVRTAHPEDREDLVRVLQSCLREAKELKIEYRALHRDGTEVYLLNQALPFVDELGQLEAVDGIVVDVSERKSLEEQIIQTEELRTLSEVSSRLAHEIRNPLTAAGGFARRLLRELDAHDPQRQKVEIIVYEVSRLEHILKMILAYIKPVSLQFTTADLNGLVQEAIALLDEELQRHQVRLEVELAEEALNVRADCGHLRHAMAHIIRNAMRHAPPQATIRVHSSKNSKALLKISYPALHVTADDLEHFFYPFVTGEPEESDYALPLTKVIVHKHGGTINIERSEENIMSILIALPVFKSHGRQPVSS